MIFGNNYCLFDLIWAETSDQCWYICLQQHFKSINLILIKIIYVYFGKSVYKSATLCRGTLA